MRLCVLGWFGHQNAGDDRIAEVLVRRLPGCHLSFLPFMPLPQEMVNAFDGMLITAGVWHSRNRLARDFHRWCRRVHVPFAAVGLGVEEVTPEMRAASDALVERSVFLWLRDHESKRLLGGDPKIVVGPDVTWAEPLARELSAAATGGSYVPGTVALNLRSWRRAAWQPEAWVEAARRAAPAGLDPWPLGPEDQAVLAPFFPDCPAGFDPDVGRRAEVVVGMRLHSLIFAAQMGVPAVGPAYDRKCEHFLAQLERPDWALDLDHADRLEQRVETLRDRREAERHHLLARGEVLTRDARELLAKASRALAAAAEGRRPRDLLGRALTWLGRRMLTAGQARQASRRGR